MYDLKIIVEMSLFSRKGRYMRELWNFILEFFEENVLNVVRTIRVTDIFDILILALIFYYLYIFIRNRRAGKLAVGLIFIVVIFFISSAFDMYALRFIFENFYQSGIIAILIVFQPEMRAALEKVGGTTFTGLKTIASESGKMAALSAEIEAISSAAGDLSREKVGALIVIERSTKLGEYIKTGVLIDSVISPYVLRNIFFNKAPLHDGAVIIKDARVHAAGCFLPLSANDDIDKDLGTRHRAAIGITEISDAVVVVISEETGTISVSVDGNLKRNYNYATLKQELNNLLALQTPSEHVRRYRKKKK